MGCVRGGTGPVGERRQHAYSPSWQFHCFEAPGPDFAPFKRSHTIYLHTHLRSTRHGFKTAITEDTVAKLEGHMSALTEHLSTLGVNLYSVGGAPCCLPACHSIDGLTASRGMADGRLRACI